MENALLCLDIYDFNLKKDHDLWEEIRKGLAAHPLRFEGEALCKLRDREQEKKGHWWHNPRNWTTENKTERDELKEILRYLKHMKAGNDEWMVANYFHILEELDPSKNHDLWIKLKAISEENRFLHSVRWKKYGAWTKEYEGEWWWWKIGEDLR